VAQDFTEVTVTALKEEAKSYKMQWPLQNQPHCTYSRDSSKILRRRLERKTGGCTWRRSVWIYKRKRN